MTKKEFMVYCDDFEDYDPDINQDQIQSIPFANAKDDRTLQVTANPSELTDSEIINFFAQCGPIEEINILFDKTKNQWKGCLYIIFESVAIVNQLIKTSAKAINGKKVFVEKKMTSTPNNVEWNSLPNAAGTISLPMSLGIPSYNMMPPFPIPMTYAYKIPEFSGYPEPLGTLSVAGLEDPLSQAGPSGFATNSINY